MNPSKLSEPGSEHSHQVALFAWVAVAVYWGFDIANNQEFYDLSPQEKKARFEDQKRPIPELKLLFAIPNGGERNAIVAGKMKAEGVRAGVSDILLPVARRGYHGFFIEMKKPGGRESDKQIEFGADVTEQGYLYTCCDHWELARDALMWYMSTN